MARKPLKLDLKKGALRAQTKTAKGKNIPASTLAKLADSSNETTRKRAQFAINASKWNKGGKKGK